jgi:hypothetical protein
MRAARSAERLYQKAEEDGTDIELSATRCTRDSIRRFCRRCMCPAAPEEEPVGVQLTDRHQEQEQGQEMKSPSAASAAPVQQQSGLASSSSNDVSSAGGGSAEQIGPLRVEELEALEHAITVHGGAAATSRTPARTHIAGA